MLKTVRYVSFLALTITSLGTMVPAAEALEANDVHQIVIAGDVLTFSQADLMNNDLMLEAASFTVLLPPGKGTFTEVGETMTYQPQPDFYGRQQLVYELDSGQDVSTATVTFHVQPPYVPLAGRWQTASCDLADCPPSQVPGHGAEIGWFESRNGIAVLCDWAGSSQLLDCREISFAGTVAGWTPMLFDYDGDGFDEIALRDPGSGELRVYSSASSGLGGEGGRLPMATLIHGLETSWPLSGAWGVGDYLGVYEAGNGLDRFVLDAGADTLLVPLAPPSAAYWPLAGDWQNEGLDRVGLIDLQSFELRHLDPQVGGQPLSFQAGELELSGVPFSGRLWSADSRSFLGFFNAETATFRLLGFWDEDPEGPLPLDMVVDPPSKTRFIGH